MTLVETIALTALIAGAFSLGRITARERIKGTQAVMVCVLICAACLGVVLAFVVGRMDGRVIRENAPQVTCRSVPNHKLSDVWSKAQNTQSVPSQPRAGRYDSVTYELVTGPSGAFIANRRKPGCEVGDARSEWDNVAVNRSVRVQHAR